MVGRLIHDDDVRFGESECCKCDSRLLASGGKFHRLQSVRSSHLEVPKVCSDFGFVGARIKVHHVGEGRNAQVEGVHVVLSEHAQLELWVDTDNSIPRNELVLNQIQKG